MKPFRIIGATLLAWALLGAATAGAVSLQPIGNFDQPIFVTSDPGNPDRLLITERNGRVISFENGVSTTLVDIESLVSCCEGERGLFSAVPAPDFDISHRLYVDYSGTASGEIHIAEVVVGGLGSPPVINDLLTIEHPLEIHYGGQLQFGPEGDLYISTGDGGPANDGSHNAQKLESRLGKILRVEPDPGGPAPFYKPPADNPSFGGAGHKPEIWSLGLRNPFRFSFDRLTGAMVIGDVGQGAREEIDYAPSPVRGKGFNYGWNCREGLIAGPATDPECATATGLVDPIFDYPHPDPGGGKAHGCAIVGGYISRDPALPELFGRYLYGDFCSGEIRSLNLSNPSTSDRSEGLEVTSLESFGEDAVGRLYVVGGGTVYRLGEPETTTPPRIKPHLGIRARGRRVKRGGRATIIAFVSPCVRDKATTAVVTLLRGPKKLERRRMNRVCTVSFRPRVTRRTHFRVKLAENETYLAAESHRLTVRPKRRR